MHACRSTLEDPTGGLFAFGLLGLFVGPVILAVAYTLLDAWVAEAPPDKDVAASG